MMVPLASILVKPPTFFFAACATWLTRSIRRSAGPKLGTFADRPLRYPGTTYSCVATYEGTNVEIIANEQGSFTTPSFVSFTEDERLIGESAKNQAAMNPENTIFDIKYAFPPCCSAWTVR